MNVGLLHPGAMGSALAAQVDDQVFWVGDGRSEETRRRAESAGLIETTSLVELVETSDLIFSVCPPASAGEVARAVRAVGFNGVYVDANAIAPSTVRELSEGFEHFVDGGIVGSPPTADNQCRVYLSGERAEDVASLLAGSQAVPVLIGPDPGTASAMKAAYAGWTKGSSALLLAVAAYAEAEGVLDVLVDEWKTSIPDLPDRLDRIAARIGRKAWRFAGEMEEIAGAYTDVDLPSGFHAGAADLYDRLSILKDRQEDQLLETILDLIVD